MFASQATAVAPMAQVPNAAPFPTSFPGAPAAVPTTAFGAVATPAAAAPATTTVLDAFSKQTTAFLVQNVLPVISQACASRGLTFTVDEMVHQLGMTPPQSFGGMNFGATAPRSSADKVSHTQLGPGKCHHQYGARSRNKGMYCSEDAVAGANMCRTHNKPKASAATNTNMFQGGFAANYTGGIPSVMPNMPVAGVPQQIPQQMPQQQQQPRPNLQARDLGGGYILEYSRGLVILQNADKTYMVVGKATNMNEPNINSMQALTHDDVKYAVSVGVPNVHPQAMPREAASPAAIPAIPSTPTAMSAAVPAVPTMPAAVPSVPTMPAAVPSVPTLPTPAAPAAAAVPSVPTLPTTAAPAAAAPVVPSQVPVALPDTAAPAPAQAPASLVIPGLPDVTPPAAAEIPASGTIPSIPTGTQ